MKIIEDFMNSQKHKLDLPAHCFEEISNLLEQDFLAAQTNGTLDQIQIAPEKINVNPCAKYLDLE